MAQSGLTVTPGNPSPPTNFASTGARPPNPPNYTKNTMADPKNWSSVNPKDFPPPFYDDGTAASLTAFAANTAALASGSGATAGGTDGTYPGTGTGTTVNNVGAVPASTSVPHEGAGTEVIFTAAVPNPSPNGQLQTSSCGPALTPGTLPNPNALHASSQAPTTPPTITALAPNNIAGVGGNTALTVTGTGFQNNSQVAIGGVLQTTQFVNATTLVVQNAQKRSSTGTLPVTVVTNGSATAATNWTFT
jgi:hypothetical protein